MNVYNDIASNPDLIIQKDLFEYTRSHFKKAIDQVFDIDTPHDKKLQNIIKQLHKNADRFAGFKSAWQTAHIRNNDPERLPLLNNKYNVSWMRTEYTHAVRSCRAAANWHSIDQDKDLYPYLEYMPSTAAEPRNDHQRLYGVVKPVDDSFWDTWLPPSDWGCRCSVKQVRDDDNAKEVPKDIKLPPAYMRQNPYKTGELFSDKHPMIAKLSDKERKMVDKAIGELTGETKVASPQENDIITREVKTVDDLREVMQTYNIFMENKQSNQKNT